MISKIKSYINKYLEKYRLIIRRLSSCGANGKGSNQYSYIYRGIDKSCGRYHFDDKKIIRRWSCGKISLDMYHGYRDSCKNWRRVFWQINCMFHLLDYEKTGVSHRMSILDGIEKEDALPKPLKEYSEVALSLISDYPEYFYSKQTLIDEIRANRATIIKIRYPDSALNKYFKSHIQRASEITKLLQQYSKIDINNSSILDVGSGRGFALLGFAGIGAKSLIGVDNEYGIHGQIGYEEMYKDLAERLALDKYIEYYNSDINNVQIEDNSIDIVISNSAVEHIFNLEGCFKKIYRLLKPEGVAHIVYNPYFCPGGHALQTFDFPWGHVILNDEQIKKYLEDNRTHEYEDSIDMLFNGLNKETIWDIEKHISDSGLELKFWEERDGFNHVGLLSSNVIKHGKQNYPKLSIRDLLASKIRIILQKPS
ncbi:hypothetical protein BMS3Abin10_00366 [bacterium BMS3Abin10]|nr:hypothetical protein BMS3Abin10_00366 [bacterium BMS3Abin10]GBE39924.1 hypothetical protein BMS3Bbin08_02558 [bacterium BMS3Bbin08]HDK42848.1 class I SAM-dependent methyltransferase [Candidatus Pacearchaeota archaeon]HDZ60904.1 class I SAM-dependent methyltransferase [Candidatus Pacearchaeota archaeon]